MPAEYHLHFYHLPPRYSVIWYVSLALARPVNMKIHFVLVYLPTVQVCICKRYQQDVEQVTGFIIKTSLKMGCTNYKSHKFLTHTDETLAEKNSLNVLREPKIIYADYTPSCTYLDKKYVK